MQTTNRVEIIVVRGDNTFRISSEIEDEDLKSGKELADKVAELAATAVYHLSDTASPRVDRPF